MMLGLVLVQALPSPLCLREAPQHYPCGFLKFSPSLFRADSPLSCSDFLLHWVMWVQHLICRCTCMFSCSMLPKTPIVEFRSNLDEMWLRLNVLHNVLNRTYKIFSSSITVWQLAGYELEGWLYSTQYTPFLSSEFSKPNQTKPGDSHEIAFNLWFFFVLFWIFLFVCL